MSEETMIAIPRYSPLCDFCMIAPDDGMKPFGINAGDVVELRRYDDEEEWKNGDLIAVRMDEEVCLRRIYDVEEFVVLSAFGIPSDVFRRDEAKPFTIEGKVIASRHIIE